jgi:hypothetical protein
MVGLPTVPTPVSVEIPLELQPWKEAKVAYSLANVASAANLLIGVHRASSLDGNASPLALIGPLSF